jgi:TetR/AcrR family transcriptional regulator, cholesterol catabolism regulator
MTGDKTRRPRKRKVAAADITIDDLPTEGMNEKASTRLLQIVNAAADLFHSKGYGPTTTRDIGKACNISPGHLYYYIKSKEDFPGMFREIHNNEISAWEESIRKEMDQLPPDELLEKAVRGYALGIHTRRKMIVFWYHAAVQIKHEDRIGTMDIERRVDNLFQEIIELGNKEGRFHVRDPYIMAINICMMCQTWALKRWLIKDNRTIDQYIDSIVDLVITMVKGPAQSGQPLRVPPFHSG